MHNSIIIIIYFYFQELTKDEDIDVNEDLVCPLTHKVFVDPVSTPFGHTYEREALLKYMAENNNMDPKAKKPIQKSLIFPQRTVKNLADIYRKSKGKLLL